MEATSRQQRAAVIVLVLFAVYLYGSLHLLDNIWQRDYPPASCQLLGGNWGYWSGWRCG